jgi:pheromone alpha factor receptor
MSAPSDTTSGSLAELYPFNLNISSTAMTELNLMLQAGSSATLWLGVQAGSALIFLLLLVLLTRPSKRGTSVFRLNTAALLLSFIRSTCQVSYFTSAFWTFEPTVNVFAADMDVNSIVVSQSLAALCAAAQASCVIGSLYLQIQAVCAPMSCQSKRLAVLIATAILAVVNVVYIWVVAILDISVCIVGWRDTNCVLLVGWWQIASWLFQGTVFLFSCVFVGKLGVAIAQRRRLGLRQFGPMHIVAICGTQTMVVPGMLLSSCFPSSTDLLMTLSSYLCHCTTFLGNLCRFSYIGNDASHFVAALFGCLGK